MMSDGGESPILIAMGELGVIRNEGSLRTLLGSCIGVVLYDRRLKVVGLAHVVMPNSKGRTDFVGKYVDTAIPEMIRRMQGLAGGEAVKLSAKIAGGANMFAQINNNVTSTIGDQNVTAVERLLETMNIPILARHCGGTAGRRLLVEVATCTVQVDIVGKPTEFL